MQLTDNETLLKNFAQFSDYIQASMEEAFSNMDTLPNYGPPAERVSKNKASLERKIEWELLELSTLKQEYQNKLKQAEKLVNPTNR